MVKKGMPNIRGKAALLEKLQQTYCRLRPSRRGGVGIFAIRPIPKNTNPFFGCHPVRWVCLTADELAGLPLPVRQMVKEFYGSEGKLFYIPEHGLNGNDISFYLNHSNQPNVSSSDGGTNFLTTRKIKAGEELGGLPDLRPRR